MKGFAGRLPVVASLMVIAFMAVWTTANRSDSSNVSSGLAGYFATGGSYVIGDLEDSVGNNVTWWGAQWSADNPMSGGSAPIAKATTQFRFYHPAYIEQKSRPADSIRISLITSR